MTIRNPLWRRHTGWRLFTEAHYRSRQALFKFEFADADWRRRLSRYLPDLQIYGRVDDRFDGFRDSVHVVCRGLHDWRGRLLNVIEDSGQFGPGTQHVEKLQFGRLEWFADVETTGTDLRNPVWNYAARLRIGSWQAELPNVPERFLADPGGVLDELAQLTAVLRSTT